MDDGDLNRWGDWMGPGRLWGAVIGVEAIKMWIHKLKNSWKRRNLGIVGKELSSTCGKTVPPGVMFTIGSGYSIYIYI